MNGESSVLVTRRQVQTIGMAAAASFLIGLVATTPVGACTDFMLPEPPASVKSVPDNLTAVSARTMDFEVNLGWQMQNQSAGKIVQSTDPAPKDGMRGMRWFSSYNFIGFTGLQYANAFTPEPVVDDGVYFDGMNEKGLSAALLWLDATWPTVSENNYPDPIKGSRNLSIHYVVNYILSRCDTVECVANLFQVSPKPNVFGEPLGGALPLAAHLIVHDAYNRSAVIEWLDKQQFIYWHPTKSLNPADKIRVMTNDPPYAAQMWFLQDPLFTLLTRQNHFKETGGYVTQPAQNVLPGDSSSGSRFVRSFKLNGALSGNPGFRYYPWYFVDMIPKKDKAVVPKLWRVQLANKVIARAEEVYGEYPAVFKMPPPHPGIQSQFHTQFTVIRDHSNKVLYVRGIYNQNLRRVVLSDVFKNKPASYTKNLYVDPLSTSKGYKLQLFQDVGNLFQDKLPDPYE